MGGKKHNRIREVLRKSFRGVRTWQLVIILLPLLFFTATLLRLNHLRMVELRNAVMQADENNDDAEILHTLTELKDYVYSHTIINVAEYNGVQTVIFGTGPFYLEHQYLRAANEAIENTSVGLVDDSNPNGNIYAAVAAICQPLAIANGWQWSSQGYLDCWTSELAKYPESGIADNHLTANVPSTELFRHNYASPIFTFTPAGIAIVICIILTLVIIVRFVIWLVLKISLVFLKRT